MMKKLCLVLLFYAMLVISVEAQGTVSAGIHLGIPMADASDIAGFNFGVDVAYLFEVSDEFQAGIVSGYTHFTGTSIDFGAGIINLEDFGFIPLAGSARYSFSDNIFGSLDLGYGINTNGGTGGFYYQPKVGYKTNAIDIFGFYKGISRDGATVGSIGVGAAYRFN